MTVKEKKARLLAEASELADIREILKKRLDKMQKKKAKEELIKNLLKNYNDIVERKNKLNSYIKKVSEREEKENER